MTINDTAQRWGCTPQWVRLLAKDGRIDGAELRINEETSRAEWFIPDGTAKPPSRKMGRPCKS